MWLFDIFNKTTKDNTPSVKVESVGWFVLNYDYSFEVYYKYYNLNPFVYSCINKRSNDIWSHWFELLIWKTNKNDDLEKFLKNSTTPTPKEFFKRIFRDYDITWNTYVFIVRDINNNPVWLQVLDPRYITPVTDKYWIVIWYLQNLNWIKAFTKDEVFHLKNDNDIDNEIVWKSKMTSLLTDIESDQEARDSNLAFFKNNQTPSSIVIIDNDYKMDSWNLTQVLWKLKEMFEWWKYQGWKNKHRTLITQWIKEVIKVQDKINDMEFLQLRKFSLEVTCAVYEVPKSLLWYTDWVSYTNWNNQYDIYRDTIEASEDKLWAFLDKILKLFDTRYEFYFIKDNLRKLAIKAEIAWKMYKTDNLISLDEAREIIQYEKAKEWDRFFNDSTSQNNTLQENKK